MSQEFTIYTLFILLAVSMGVIFQFMLAKIKQLNIVQQRIMKSIHFIHDDVVELKNKKSTTSFKRNDQDVLRGDLTLEYRGARADTRATFMLDKK
tara:strand:+ start:368 stop:652 length:285 start_codon:yes stop_codon:yes gene_type:complete